MKPKIILSAAVGEGVPRSFTRDVNLDVSHG